MRHRYSCFLSWYHNFTAYMAMHIFQRNQYYVSWKLFHYFIQTMPDMMDDFH